ncbi:MAG: FtsW/RodA/SpoVE family cell cycle protein [Candidatus Omnitrophica bacterium]|nr:FtsW/RodA/SpoVE family cell cycle protein [Candidatus Omnitrophota bacterium]
MSRKFDVLILYVILVFILGSANLYSASSNFPHNYLAKQIIWFAVSVLVGIVVYAVGIRNILNMGLFLYAFALLLLVVVLLIPSEGARRWISIGFFNIQPSAVMKFALPIFLAAVFQYSNIDTVFSFIPPIFFTLLGSFLIAKEPDLGGALMLLPALGAFFILKKAYFRKALVWIVAGLLMVPVLYFKLEPYQKRRLLTFVNPNIDPLGAGYTLMQSKIAVGSGNIFGKGWLKGAQGQLRFLPESHTDFVFPVFAEEWGFAGIVVLLGLFFLMLRRMYAIAESQKEYSSRMLMHMFLVTITVQIVINLGMTIGILPIVGLPLPFFSYGGSDLVVTVAMIALFLRRD